MSRKMDVLHLLSYELNIDEFHNEKRTLELYEYVSTLCKYKSILHPEWLILSARLKIYEIRVHAPNSFSSSTKKLKSRLTTEYYNFVMSHINKLNSMIKKDRDMIYNIFELENDMLLLFDVETPQYMFLRTATFLWFPNIEKIQETYDDLSLRRYRLDTNVMLNSGTHRPQLLNNFGIIIKDNILDKLTDSWKNIAMLRYIGGSLTVDLSSIKGDIIPIINIIKNICLTISSCKSQYDITICLPDWHKDIEKFLKLRSSENIKYAILISDEFMRRVEAPEEFTGVTTEVKTEVKTWTLFNPNGLEDKWGVDFEIMYRKREENKSSKTKKVKVTRLWNKIIYNSHNFKLIFKDTCNRNSEHNNFRLSGINCSFLSSEFITTSSHANISLCKCIKNKVFDFNMLSDITSNIVNTLNKVLDRNCTCITKNMIEQYRPITIGVSDMANLFLELGMSWENKEARNLHRDIFETIYYFSIKESMNYTAYNKYKESQLYNKMFYFDLKKQEKIQKKFENITSSISCELLQKNIKDNDKYRYNWKVLKEQIEKGVGNLINISGTARPHESHVLIKNVVSGQAFNINRYLVDDMKKYELWNLDNIYNICNTNTLPEFVHQELKDKYKLLSDIDKKVLMGLSTDRENYCHIQELISSGFNELDSFLFWKSGIKIFYLRK